MNKFALGGFLAHGNKWIGWEIIILVGWAAFRVVWLIGWLCACLRQVVD
jgi:hypothetical protein